MAGYPNSRDTRFGARRMKTSDAIFVGVCSAVVIGLWASAAWATWAMFHG
jgi:hypothetical protein